jgi:hypothetical protein
VCGSISTLAATNGAWLNQVIVGLPDWAENDGYL